MKVWSLRLRNIPSVTSAMRSSLRKCGFRRLVGPVHEGFHILQVAESQAGYESSRDLENRIFYWRLQMKVIFYKRLQMNMMKVMNLQEIWRSLYRVGILMWFYWSRLQETGIADDSVELQIEEKNSK